MKVAMFGLVPLCAGFVLKTIFHSFVLSEISSVGFQEQLEKAVVYLAKAINVAKENSRYVQCTNDF